MSASPQPLHAPQVVAELSRLVQLEADASEAYSAAISLVGEGPIATELGFFRLEHQRRFLELCETVLRLGYNPPEVTPDVKGVVIGALTPPRPRLSAEEVLEAVRGNEQLTNSVYAKVAAKNLPKGIRELVERAREEERHHLDWVQRALSRRLWDRPAMAHP